MIFFDFVRFGQKFNIDLYPPLEIRQPTLQYHPCKHGIRRPREEIVLTEWPKIHFHSQIFKYGRSIFCLLHRPNFSKIFDFCLHWVSVVRDSKEALKNYTESKLSLLLTLPIPAAWCPNVEPVLKITWKIVS